MSVTTDRDAKAAALRQYARAHDQFTALEDQLRRMDLDDRARYARYESRLCLRAWLAERDNPKPEGLP